MSTAAGPNIRPLQPPDAGWLRKLWNESAIHDPLCPRLLEEKIWGDEDFRPEGAFAVFQGDEPEGFVVGVVRSSTDGPRGYVKMLAVRPDKQGRGCGRLLLETLEQALRGSGACTVRLGESLPNYLVPGVDFRYEAALEFFDRQGYRRFDEACNMTVELQHQPFETEASERRLARAGIRVRRAESDDKNRLQPFLQRHWPAWQPEVWCSLGRRKPAVHLAFRGSELLAFSAHDGNNAGCGSFGPMGTAPAARGLGIGRILLWRCLRDIKALGFERAVIPWVAPTGFYEEHVGATVARRFHRYEKNLKP